MPYKEPSHVNIPSELRRRGRLERLARRLCSQSSHSATQGSAAKGTSAKAEARRGLSLGMEEVHYFHTGPSLSSLRGIFESVPRNCNNQWPRRTFGRHGTRTPSRPSSVPGFGVRRPHKRGLYQYPQKEPSIHTHQYFRNHMRANICICMYTYIYIYILILYIYTYYIIYIYTYDHTIALV